VRASSQSFEFFAIAGLLIYSNIKLIVSLSRQDGQHASKRRVIILMTVIFTVTYLLRAVTLLVAAICKTKSNRDIIEQVFGRYMFRMTTLMLWDLPAILSTVYLHHTLLKQLDHEHKIISN
jgi:hypothetical protein